MKRRFFVSMLLGLFIAGGMLAKTTQTLLINGEQVDKVVSSITFDGDKVVLHFGDESEAHDMNLVSLALDYSTGLENLNVYSFNSKIEGGTMSVSGLEAGTPVFIFNLSGASLASAKAGDNGNAELDIQNLPGGIYILKAGNNCVKFVKR